MRRILGEKLYLRPMLIEDSEILVSWRNKFEILKWMVTSEVISLESHINWYNNRKNRYDYMIIDKFNEKPIGTLNYKIIKDGVAEAGKLIGNQKYWGRGYAKEAFKIWIDFGFDSINLDKIIVNTKSNNKVNIALNTKLGFKITNHFLKKNINFTEMTLNKYDKR